MKRARAPSDAPLLAWGDQLRAAKIRRRSLRRSVIVVGTAVAAVLATAMFPPQPRLVWNASASAPIGLYSISPNAEIMPGDMAVAWLPGPSRQLAASRHYLPGNVPLVKRVAAGPGDHVCGFGPGIFINGSPVVYRKTRDRIGRQLPAWHGCQHLRNGQYLLLMPSADSFDGRYFGVTTRSEIIGKATLLWAR